MLGRHPNNSSNAIAVSAKTEIAPTGTRQAVDRSSRDSRYCLALQASRITSVVTGGEQSDRQGSPGDRVTGRSRAAWWGCHRAPSRSFTNGVISLEIKHGGDTTQFGGAPPFGQFTNRHNVPDHWQAQHIVEHSRQMIEYGAHVRHFAQVLMLDDPGM